MLRLQTPSSVSKSAKSKITVSHVQVKKNEGRKIAALTAYDYPAARLQDKAGIDVILVGDSLGTNVLGYRSEHEGSASCNRSKL